MQHQYLDQLAAKLLTTFQLITPGYSQLRGPLLLGPPTNYGGEGISAGTQAETLPFRFESTSRETDSFEIELPKAML